MGLWSHLGVAVDQKGQDFAQACLPHRVQLQQGAITAGSTQPNVDGQPLVGGMWSFCGQTGRTYIFTAVVSFRRSVVRRTAVLVCSKTCWP